MEEKLSEIIIRLCKTLNQFNVQYLMIGGSAIALHGYFRMSRNESGQLTNKFDLDFWYNPTYSNYFNLLNAIEAIDQDVNAFRDEQMPNPAKSFFKMQFEEFTLDFLPTTGTPLKFRDSFNFCDRLLVDGTEIPFINIDDLIHLKEILGRKKDLEVLNN